MVPSLTCLSDVLGVAHHLPKSYIQVEHSAQSGRFSIINQVRPHGDLMLMPIECSNSVGMPRSVCHAMHCKKC